MVTLTKNENKDLQKKLDKASMNITNRVNEMDAMISETIKETDALQTENEELKENRKKDKQTIKKLEADVETLEKKIGSLQRENSSLTDQLQV
jgi:peptidoglycan hydrolase CwlO-like protein